MPCCLFSKISIMRLLPTFSTSVEDTGTCNMVIWPFVLLSFFLLLLMLYWLIFSNTFLGSPSLLVLRLSTGLPAFSVYSPESPVIFWASTIESLLTFEFVSHTLAPCSQVHIFRCLLNPFGCPQGQCIST